MEKKEVFNWPPLESDPEILTDYMQSLGMSKSWELLEVIGLDPELLCMVPKSTVALVLTYARAEAKEVKAKKTEVAVTPDINFYMWQTKTLDNACGLIACIHAVFNNLAIVPVAEGSPLKEFYNVAIKQSPEERAATLDGFTSIKSVHRDCGKKGQSNQVERKEDTQYHFICFTRNDKKQLIELDGVVKKPILLSEKCDDADFIKTVANEILKRLSEGIVSDRMALMALSLKE
eukprot:TRINITY_DN2329_c0_g1_i1.p1 TRINITY_DN2329_c0_g1~~TRINITY_DN2329_c0_g1_i1.p1  ORF type:complete len:274 (-),score=84.58 TRINITY_DN2329_c0_g1_i1:118-816(-)